MVSRVEDAILDYCKDNLIALVAYSPIGRGFLAGSVRDMAKLSIVIFGTACHVFRRRVQE